MADDLQQQPGPEWRAAQHRIRNDLQTLSSMLRLSRRRAPNAEIIAQFPEWLNALAALYDAVPLWDDRKAVSIAAITRALLARGHYAPPVHAEGGEDAPVLVQSALATALCLQGLLTFGCRNAAPGGTVRVNLSADAETVRAEAVYVPVAEAPTGWPPLNLALAAEALDGRYALGADGEDAVAALLIPRR